MEDRIIFILPYGIVSLKEKLLASGCLKAGSQYAAQVRDTAKRVVPRRVCREFRLRVYPSDVATCSVSALPRR